MRVTTSMYYDSIYGTNNHKLTKELFDVNKQIASGIKIQYASDDVRTFTETMRLDNEVTVLGQVKKSTESGYKVADQSDIVLNEFSTSLDRMETLLIQAANETNSNESLDAIANELRGLEEHFKGLANTSINGQYLFSGSAVDTKPIAADGSYRGNDSSMNAFVGSNNQQQYNLSGAELFLGEEPSQKREITSNVVNRNLLADYPQLQASGDSTESALKSSDSIRSLMGDIDASTTPANSYYFYLRGTQSDGTSFNKTITLQDTDTIDNLLTKIGEAYGNSGSNKVVNVTLNDYGEIVIDDKLNASSKLDFHMVGAVDFNTADGDDKANINDPVYANSGEISNLDTGETDFAVVAANATPGLFVKEFVKSDLTTPTAINGITYDKASFAKDGSVISSNVSQILKSDNSFATPQTKLSEVADLSQGTLGTLDGTTFDLVGVDINGNAYNATIDLATAGSTFTVNGTTYTIYDMDPTGRKAVPADEMTYQQLMDVTNMVVTATLPAGAADTDYDKAVKDSSFRGDTYLSYDGKITFSDLINNSTPADISLYDANAGTFGGDSSVMTFNASNALTVRDPKTDFFKTLNDAITAVEEHKLYPDASSGTAASIGIENAIQMTNDLHEHISRSQAKVGSQSNTLNDSLQRAELLEISTITLRSSVIDTDLAEASLRLTQLNTNYQAMLSTVGQVSQLSLVNYL
ncbi:flagellin N-terminal helical domain-containing protein [Sulfurimonas sp.]